MKTFYKTWKPLKELRGTPNETLIAIHHNGQVKNATVLGNLPDDERWKFQLDDFRIKTHTQMSGATFIILAAHDLRRPTLNKVPVGCANPKDCKTGAITMNIGQWDCLLEEAYARGIALLELDWDEKKIVNVYLKPDTSLN